MMIEISRASCLNNVTEMLLGHHLLKDDCRKFSQVFIYEEIGELPNHLIYKIHSKGVTIKTATNVTKYHYSWKELEENTKNLLPQLQIF